MNDFSIVLRKEWLEILNGTAKERARIFSSGIVFLIVTVVFPFQIRNFEVCMGVALGIGALNVILISMLTSATAYAAERERHTLETLLSTRLSDRAIFLGKLAGCLTSGLALGAFYQLAGLLIVTGLFGKWQTLPLSILLGLILLAGSVFPAIMFTSAGLLLSARSSSVKQVMTTMSSVMMVVLLVPTLTLTFIAPRLGDAPVKLWQVLLLALVVPAVVLILDAALLTWGLLRIRRERLMLV